MERQKVNFSTKVAVETKNWSEKKCQVTTGDKQAGDKNLIIESILARINNVFVKYRLRDKKLWGSCIVPWQSQPKMQPNRYIKNGRSDTPCNCALKLLILAFNDSADAFVENFRQ